MAERQGRQVSRWEPLRELEPWARGSLWGPSFGRLFEDVFGERAEPRSLAVALDVTESDEHYTVTAEVPGVKRDDITVELHEGVLTIRGEKKSEREETKEKGRWLERTYGSFSRTMSLPSDADPNKVDASFQDGVLRVRIAKQPEAKPQTIAIKS